MGIGQSAESWASLFDHRGGYLILWGIIAAVAIGLHLLKRDRASSRMAIAAALLAWTHAGSYLLAAMNLSMRTDPLPQLPVPIAFAVLVTLPFLTPAAPVFLALNIAERFRTLAVWKSLAVAIALSLVAIPATWAIESAPTMLAFAAFAVAGISLLRNARTRLSVLAAITALGGLAAMTYALVNNVWLHQYRGAQWFLDGPGFGGAYVAHDIAAYWAFGAFAVIIGVALMPRPGVPNVRVNAPWVSS